MASGALAGDWDRYASCVHVDPLLSPPYLIKICMVSAMPEFSLQHENAIQMTAQTAATVSVVVITSPTRCSVGSFAGMSPDRKDNHKVKTTSLARYLPPWRLCDQHSELSQPQSATRSAASPADIQLVRVEEDAWHSTSGGYALQGALNEVG